MRNAVCGMRYEEVLIALGGNLGDVPQTFKRAVNILNCILSDCRMSDLYLSTAVYDKPGAIQPEQGAPDYINAVLRGRTTLNPYELLEHLLNTEQQIGRVRPAPECSPRVIDLDLLLYGDEVIAPQKEGDLELPHPRMHQRAFVLVPACDVAPEWIHPVLKQTLSELRDRCLILGNTIQKI